MFHPLRSFRWLTGQENNFKIDCAVCLLRSNKMKDYKTEILTDNEKIEWIKLFLQKGNKKKYHYKKT